MRPLCIDLFCGLGGWSEGFLAEGYDCVGFDIERHQHGKDKYPAHLVVQDVLTLHGSQFKNAAAIVASPPCQEYSRYVMPFGALWREHHSMDDDGAPAGNYLGKSTIFNHLFRACFRIATEAGVPIVVENVKGAQRWIGPSKYNFGSFHLWGDVPALMPNAVSIKNTGGSWFGERDGKPLERNDLRDMRRDENGECVNATAAGGWDHPGKSMDGVKQGGNWWHDPASLTRFSSRSSARKAASAQIAKIPFELSRHIARCFKP